MASTPAKATAALSDRDTCLFNIWQAFPDDKSKNAPHMDAETVPFYNGFLEKCNINEIKISFNHQKGQSDCPWKFDLKSNTGNVWAQNLARPTLLTNFGVAQVDDKTQAACWDEAQENLKARFEPTQWKSAIDTAFYMTKLCLRMERDDQIWWQVLFETSRNIMDINSC